MRDRVYLLKSDVDEMGSSPDLPGTLLASFAPMVDVHGRDCSVEFVRVDLYEARADEIERLKETLKIVAYEEFSEPEDAQAFAAKALGNGNE